ncbi:MAG TPA: cyclic nucleotide-binding domain-containing protein [Myxococcales bacterium]|nr:cyclic nucleotide-binding domain-containing protein [Myxococcales bacterium]
MDEIIADAVIEEPSQPPPPPPPVSQPGATPASGGPAPPGLKPKRITTEIPIQAGPDEEVVELTVRKSPPPAPAPALPAPVPAPVPVKTTSRIWLPDSFTPPPGATPPPAPPKSKVAAPEPEPAGDMVGSDLEVGFAALSKFDELDLDMAPPEPAQVPAPPPAQAAPVKPAAAAPPPPAPRGKPPGIPSFAELELEGSSLLHAVEMAAQAGISQRAEAAEPERTEESMSGVAEDFQGDSRTQSGLPKIPLFSDLSADAFIELFDRCPLRRFGPGERIIEQGSVGESFFVICAGAVRVVRQDGVGKQKELAILQEGAFFGEVALLSGAPRTASVISHAEETQLLEISATVLAQLSHRYPQVAAALKKFCRQRLLANVMNSSPLFKPFGKKDRKELVEKFRARDVNKSDLIIREGAATDGLYVVLSGEVVVTKGKVRLAVLREGEIFGEMSLLQKTPATATVAAAKRTSLHRLPREAFDEVIVTHPQVLMLVSELSQTRQKSTEAALSGELLV